MLHKHTLSLHYFVYPQETGNKTDVRFMALTDQEGKGLLIDAQDHLLSMSALLLPSLLLFLRATLSGDTNMYSFGLQEVYNLKMDSE